MAFLLTTAQVAEELRVSEEYVREHAAELGGRRLGNSRRSPLRFDREGLDAWWRSRSLEAAAAAGKPQRPGPRRVPSGVKLFPVGVDD